MSKDIGEKCKCIAHKPGDKHSKGCWSCHRNHCDGCEFCTGVPMSNSTQNDLKRARLVPIEVFGAEDGYGLCDAVSAWSDCNRADGMIFRLDDDFEEEYRNKEDTVEIWATEENITKLKTHFKKWTNQK